MSYGLTPEGFSYMTVPVVYDQLAAGMRTQPGLSNLRTDPTSPFANESAPFVEQVGNVWVTLYTLYQSLNPDTAEDASLDARAASIGKSRYPAKKSKVLLTLYNRTSTNTVNVLAGKLLRQSATGVLWETLADAEIPALSNLFEDLAIDSIENQSPGIDRVTFNDDPDLTPVAIGDSLTIEGAANASNNGTFSITAKDLAGYWIEIANEDHTDGTDDEDPAMDVSGTITDTEASVLVDGQSVEYGPFQASVDTINTVIEPQTGLDAVSNQTAAEVGQDRELDTPFRTRILQNPVISQGGIYPAVLNRLLEVDGVSYATIEENDTASIVDGMEPHSIRATLVGGADQDIWNALGQFKGMGIGTNGTESGYWTDPRGLPKLVRFNRVTKLNPYILVELVIGTGYPSGTATATIKAALEGVKYTHGDDLIVHILDATVSNLRLTGVLGIVVKVSMSPDPTLSANLPADPSEVFVIDPNRITVTTSS
jgi:uncharacterized phage protein gp47/JayE